MRTEKTRNHSHKKLIAAAVVVAAVACIGGALYAHADTLVMNDTVQSWGLNVYTGHYTPFGEYASPTSSLVGQSFNNMTMIMKKVGSPTGNITFGVFAPDLSVKKFFGNLSASSLTGAYAQHSFQLPFTQTYTIASGDRIGLKFPGGNASNNVSVMTDQTNTFNGTSSYLSYYLITQTSAGWQTIAGVDVTMTLRQTFLGNYSISIIPPANILSVTTNSSRNISNLGNYTITDPNDPNPTVTNNSTGSFPIGKTHVLWKVHDKNGQVTNGTQLVTVISVPAPTDVNNRVIMINDDDGPKAAYQYGLPILDKYGIKATWFVICGFVGGSNTYYMNWAMVHGLSSDGQDVQSHTMTHRDPNHLSQADLDYEYGQGKRCLINNGTSNVHMAASPLGTGDQNMTVVQTWERYFDMVRSGHAPRWNVNCSQGTSETNCAPYNMTTGQLMKYNRYNIQYYSHDSVHILDGLNDTKMLGDFIANETHATKANTNSTTIQIPIILYHTLVKTNTGSSYQSGATVYTSTILFDAEMKYLKDNGFKFYNFNNLKYDANTNLFHFQ